MIVVSITSTFPSAITYGKQYTIEYEQDSYIRIIDDNGDINLFPRHFFISLYEYRELILSKIDGI